MKQIEKFKEFIRGLSSGMKKGLIIGGVVLVVGSVVAAAALNKGQTADPYVTLFSGLNQQEASEVMAKLQDLGVDYRYQQDGRVLVDSLVADKTRATLAVEGYPKNGFTYDTYLNNVNMMSTETDKDALKVWAMQDSLSATIRQFDGVDRAVVQISPGENKKYVLDDSGISKPTASVMVVMRDGTSPTAKQVEGIQRLVAKSVANMDMGDVAVIDGNGIDVSVKKNDQDTVASDEKMAYEEKAQLMLESKILNVLENMYGRNNVRVSVRCTVDMQKMVSEESSYTAPNTEQNAGYISRQTLTGDSTGGAGVGGVPGAGANANVPQYNTQTGAGEANSSYSSDTDYALDQRKIQRQYEGGDISDVSVAVSINTDALQVNKDDLVSLVARAAGIDPATQGDKIVIVNSQWKQASMEGSSQPVINPNEGEDPDQQNARSYLPIIIAGCVAALLIILLVVILLIRRSKKKAAREIEEAMLLQNAANEAEVAAEVMRLKVPTISAEDERGKEVKDNIRSFTEENPEISAQLLKNWLRGEDDDA